MRVIQDTKCPVNRPTRLEKVALVQRKSRPVKEPMIAARLAELKRERSIRAFAMDCGVNYRRLAVWLEGNNAPEAENLRRIANATGASVDWLLGIPGAEMMRDKSRSQTTLEIDLASYVRRELTRRYPLRLPKGSEPYEWFLRAATLLRAAVDSVDEEARIQRTTLESREPAGRLLAAARELVKRRKTLPDDARASIETLLDLSKQLLHTGRGRSTDSMSVFLFPRSSLKEGQSPTVITSPPKKRPSPKRRKS